MLLGDVKPVDWDTIRFSVHYKADAHEQRDLAYLPFAESFAYTGSMGLENELTLLNEKLSLVGGISYDWFDVTDAETDPNTDGNIIDAGTPDKVDEFNPMVGTTYRLTDTVKLFASVAKKTRFPTLSQIYSGKDPVTGNPSPNLTLEAETAINYAAGISWTLRDLLKILSPEAYRRQKTLTRGMKIMMRLKCWGWKSIRKSPPLRICSLR
jgi:iron complex outermembrane receptor protein